MTKDNRQCVFKEKYKFDYCVNCSGHGETRIRECRHYLPKADLREPETETGPCYGNQLYSPGNDFSFPKTKPNSNSRSQDSFTMNQIRTINDSGVI